MKKRVAELMEFERMLGMLFGEIFYHHSIVKKACTDVSTRCSEPFQSWLVELSSSLESDFYKSSDRYFEGETESATRECVEEKSDFKSIWDKSLENMKKHSNLKQEDIEEMKNIGKTLGYLDYKNQEQGFHFEQEQLVKKIDFEKAKLSNGMKIAVVFGVLCGMLVTICLV